MWIFIDTCTLPHVQTSLPPQGREDAAGGDQGTLVRSLNKHYGAPTMHQALTCKLPLAGG